MACNCKKVVRQPYGTRPTKDETQKPAEKPASQSFTLERRDGTTQAFGSRLEAEAARVRSGGVIR